MEQFSLLIVTGMSGAGKTRALQSLEDLGYFCIDNLPPVLLPKLTELCCGGDRIAQLATVVDIRGGDFFDALNESLEKLQEMKVDYKIIFMEASDEVLISRYKESRRSHPLSSGGRITTGLQKERKILEDIRSKADFIIDTSNMKAAALKAYLKKEFTKVKGSSRMTVNIVSFGFKHGIPMDADMIWDVRFLPNPFYIEELRNKTGRVPAVSEYINSFDVTQEFKKKYFDMMEFLMPRYEQEGKSQMIIGVGCTGGMHRSVCMAEELGRDLRAKDMRVIVEHRDMMKNDVEEDYEIVEEPEVLGGEK